MKYLILSADYHNSHILIDEYESSLINLNLDLPKKYKRDLYLWNTQYKEIIYFSPSKKNGEEEIEKLDKVGVELTKKLKEILKETKIKYRSLGTGDFLYHC